MAKTIEVVVPASEAAALLADAQRVEGMLGIQHLPGVGREPEGDLLRFTTTDRGLLRFMHVLDARQVGTRTCSARRGLRDSLTGYAALLGATLGGLVLILAGLDPLRAYTAYLEPGILVRYWSGLTLEGVLVSCAAAVGGALLLASNRSALTSGVMIALALVPAASLVPLALLAGEPSIAGRA